MKRRTILLVAIMLMEICSNGIVNCQTGTPVIHNIPVYPGASLQPVNGPAEESTCCDFVTKDALDKVIAFYEIALKIKAFDATALAAKYPDMKPQINNMTSQMPPQMKIRFFVLQETVFQGKKGAELFEVTSDPSGTHFTVTGSQFLPKDAHYAEDWQEANAKTAGTDKPKKSGTEQLSNALPSNPPVGFTKGEINSETSGNPTINVTYSKLVKKGTGGEDGAGNLYNTITVTITDASGDLEFANGIIKAEGQGETAVKVKGKYDGKENVEKNDFGCVGSGKVFLVNNRYLVEIRAEHICDLEVLNQFINSMHLESL
jgi:hypothetical protein